MRQIGVIDIGGTKIAAGTVRDDGTVPCVTAGSFTFSERKWPSLV